MQNSDPRDRIVYPINKLMIDSYDSMSLDQNETVITRVTSEKDLGITFDEKLIFREHIPKKVALTNRNLGLIFQSFTYISRETYTSRWCVRT